MIPSQTIYLRKKNEELLTVLQENARHLNRKVEICSELLRGRPRYCEEEFTEYRCKPPEMSPTTRCNQSSDIRQPVRTAHTKSPHRTASAIQIRSTSAGRLRSPRQGHSACLPTRPISQESPKDSRWSKLQQDLSCHAHMHGYTLSHALSKCYCTRKEESDIVGNFTGSSRSVPQPFTRKTRIPPRLKEKRYQANSPKRRPCSVKWAVPHEPIPHQLPGEAYGFHLPIEDCDQENQKHAASLCGSSYAQGDAPVKTKCDILGEPSSGIDSDWFLKVKNFRKSNWDDCHAPERQKNDKCDCNRVYMIGERMFLEPVTSSFMNKECCCSKPREDPNPSPRDTVVTLPKVRSDVRKKSPKKKELKKVPNPRPEYFSGTYSIDGPCFLNGHKTRHDDGRIRAFVQQRPPDSFALRYQKGVDPRKP